MNPGRPAPGIYSILVYEGFAVQIILLAHFLDRFGADIFFELQPKSAMPSAHNFAQYIDFHALEYPGFAFADVGLADHPCAGL